MKVKEVEELLEITRANIRFYEKEGLLSPGRGENGYRSYREEDVERLKKIILFRKLGISIPDIKKIFEEEVTVSTIIRQNILSLNRQLEEIKGAIDVCKQMEKDAEIDSTFDLEKYWDIVEQEELSGNTFYNNLKDYIQFEGNTFKSLWNGTFLYDLDTSVKKRGWLIALMMMLGICVVRGLSYQFLWKWGSFWYGFSYPFVLFLIISVITLPMYLLNCLYKDKEAAELSQEVNKRKIPLSGLWKVLGGIVYFFMFLIGIPIFWEKVIYNRVMCEGKNYIITGSPFILYCIVALYLLYLTVWLYSSYGVFGNIITKEKGFQSHLPERVKKRVLAASVGIFMISVLVYGTWHDCITAEGITKRHFFWTKSYSWDDVNYYVVSAKFDGTLQYTIVIKDGTPISLMGEISSSNLDEKEYPNGEDDFMLQLTKQFVNLGIPIKVGSWEKLHKKLNYDYWDEYAEEIRAIVE